MAYYLLLLAVPILGILALLFAGPKDKKGSYSWVQFFSKGREAGFSLKEVELLRRISQRAELDDPTAIFWNLKQLDLCIKAVLRRARLTGDENSQETQDFLSRLYEYRKRVEFEQPQYAKGILSSRAIGEGQPVRMLVDRAGVIETSVLRNSDRFVTVARPPAGKFPASFDWKGRRVAIYFWRQNDAGYVFDTYVLDVVNLNSQPVLQLSHSDSLFRTQKRRSVRAKTKISCYLYLVRDEARPELLEASPGMRCIIEDLSEDGCAVTIGGKAAVGLKVKLQFDLGDETVAFSGTVRSSNYDEDRNRSLLHIEAVPISIPTRNRILAKVFGVNPDAELEAAFSVFAEDGDDVSVDSAMANASRNGMRAVGRTEDNT